MNLYTHVNTCLPHTTPSRKLKKKSSLKNVTLISGGVFGHIYPRCQWWQPSTSPPTSQTHAVQGCPRQSLAASRGSCASEGASAMIRQTPELLLQEFQAAIWEDSDTACINTSRPWRKQSWVPWSWAFSWGDATSNSTSPSGSRASPQRISVSSLTSCSLHFLAGLD